VRIALPASAARKSQPMPAPPSTARPDSGGRRKTAAAATGSRDADPGSTPARCYFASPPLLPGRFRCFLPIPACAVIGGECLAKRKVQRQTVEGMCALPFFSGRKVICSRAHPALQIVLRRQRLPTS